MADVVTHVEERAESRREKKLKRVNLRITSARPTDRQTGRVTSESIRGPSRKRRNALNESRPLLHRRPLRAETKTQNGEMGKKTNVAVAHYLWQFCPLQALEIGKNIAFSKNGKQHMTNGERQYDYDSLRSR